MYMVGASMAALLLWLQVAAAAPKRNVLYIVVDDLRPELPPYGHTFIHAPHITALAKRGVTFNRAYCQQAVCGPSRNSFMSGRRPNQTLSWNFLSDFRSTPTGPQWTSMPGLFLKAGYMTLGTGKLFHPGLPANGDGTLSWSNVSIQFNCNHSGAGKPGTYCLPDCTGCTVAGPSYAPHPRWCAINASENGDGDHFADIETLQNAQAKLAFAAENRKKTGQPFFMGMGLQKPHLDFRFPAPFLDYYPSREEIPLPKHRVPPATQPQVAYHDPAQSPAFKRMWAGWGYVDPWTPMRKESVQDMRLHYYAATSFMDSIVGTLLQQLNALGMEDDTCVVFHGDHGWHLGEGNMYKKFLNTELGTRVPLIIAAPWLQAGHGKAAAAIVELVDVYPTLAALAGVPLPRDEPVPLAGLSLAGLLTDPQGAGPKAVALSQFPRCPVNESVPWRSNLCIEVKSSKFAWMGYSYRNDNWRYTAWFRWNGSVLRPIVPSRRRNGTDGFFDELYGYTSVDESDFDELDAHEVSAEEPATADRLFASLIQAFGLGPSVEEL